MIDAEIIPDFGQEAIEEVLEIQNGQDADLNLPEFLGDFFILLQPCEKTVLVIPMFNLHCIHITPF